VSSDQSFSRSEDKRAENNKEVNKYLEVSEYGRLVPSDICGESSCMAIGNGDSVSPPTQLKDFCPSGFFERSKQGSVRRKLTRLSGIPSTTARWNHQHCSEECITEVRCEVELELAALERLVDMTRQDLQRGGYPDETG
jgi:hypothetical protein